MIGLFSIGVILVIIIIIANKPFWEFVAAEIKVRRPLAEKYRVIINKHNSFYQKLPRDSKLLFEKKVNRFIYSKNFVPRGIAEVTDEMESLIASSAVQLTFGLPDVTLKHFDRILVYPNDYYSAINRRYHRGEVNPRLKTIVLSWHHFVEGFANENDGMNLGLHEMAHALKFENIIENGEHHFFELEEYIKWLHMAANEITNIRNGHDSIFRKYASVNEEEFFAVSMEVYFEQPHQLFEYNPALYKTLSNLLRQDIIKLYGKQSA